MKQLTVRLPIELYKAIKLLAIEDKRSVNKTLEIMAESYLQENAKHLYRDLGK